MKPGPFKDVELDLENSKYFLVSKPDKPNSVTGKTTLLDKEKKKIWEMDEYIGRKKIKISQDGKIIVLYGSKFWGWLFSPGNYEKLIYIYVDGKLKKQIDFEDIFLKPLSTIAKDKQFNEHSGGWYEVDQFVKEIQIDSKLQKISIKRFDLVDVEFTF